MGHPQVLLRRAVSVRESEKREMENLRVVLVETRNPLNIGAVARAMSNFGAMKLRVVKPYEKAFREAVSAVGAGKVLKAAEEFGSLREAVADCSLVVGTTAVGNREIRQPLRGLEEAGGTLRGAMKSGNVAILFGSEKRGLSNEDLSFCHWLMRIPTREEHRSMNLGQAVAVCLYEMRRVESSKSKVEREEKGFTTEGAEGPQSAQRRVNKEIVGAEEMARMETVERVGEVLLEALRKSGYVGKRGERLAEEKLRRMLRRFAMEEGDAEVLLGMMRKILWKVEREP
jgi:TrmH family RNA methyltransferase